MFAAMACLVMRVRNANISYKPNSISDFLRIAKTIQVLTTQKAPLLIAKFLLAIAAGNLVRASPPAGNKGIESDSIAVCIQP
jgi:hypothetical protein